MIHGRDDYDYNRIQDPAADEPEHWAHLPGTPIGTDEPVILFRAQDKHFLEVLEHYKRLNQADPDADPRVVASLEQHIVRAWHWRDEHGCKTPDL